MSDRTHFKLRSEKHGEHIHIMELYSEKIKRDLKRLGWTQIYLAEQIGMTRQGLSVALKRKTAPLRTIGIIADILGVDPKDLLLTD